MARKVPLVPPAPGRIPVVTRPGSSPAGPSVVFGQPRAARRVVRPLELPAWWPAGRITVVGRNMVRPGTAALGQPVRQPAAVGRPAPTTAAVEIVVALRALTRELAPRSTRIEALLARLVGLSDDLYNNAVLTNPAAFAGLFAKRATLSLTLAQATAGGVLLYDSDLLDTVIVYVRADNDPAGTGLPTTQGDVFALLLSYAQGGLAEGQVEGQKSAAIVLRPQQQVYVNAKALTYPVSILATVIPLRGRVTVFGG